MKTIAAVYTGTGNSLYLAKLIPDAEVHLIEEFMDGRYEMPADTERLALVFPAYCFSVPYPMRRFISEYLGNRDNSSLGYIYAFITCGATALYTLYDTDRCLQDIGCALSYAESFRFPDAYLPLKKKAVTEKETETIVGKTLEKIRKAIEDTENETIKLPKKIPGWRIMRRFGSTLKPRANEKLKVSGRCTGCGICVSQCHSQVYKLRHGGYKKFIDNITKNISPKGDLTITCSDNPSYNGRAAMVNCVGMQLSCINGLVEMVLD